ncbi:MAG: LAGLIDADG family homing endonuclease [Candidatus Heimdallarchaeota archaeon]
MLTWQTDPLLVDPAPVPWPQWRTANHLLKEDLSPWTPRLFLRHLALNFYGIMVRKSDFVKSGPRDRLQPRFPYLCLTSRLQELIANNSDRLAVSLSQYYQKAESYGPRAWRKKLQRYLQQGRVPLPFFRVLGSLQENEADFLLTHFKEASLEAFRHEAFRFPIEVTEPLAYFLGACAGDGSLKRHQVWISDGHEEYMHRLLRLTRQLTGTNPTFCKEPAGNAWLIILKSKWLARLVHFLADQPFGKKYEALRMPCIFQTLPNRQSLENRYVQGWYDTDGSCHKESSDVGLKSKSHRLVKDLERFFKRRKILYRKYARKNGLQAISVARSSIKQFAETVGFLSPAKEQALLQLLSRGPSFLEFTGPKPSTLTPSGYFNFRLLPKLLVVDAYDFLQEKKRGYSPEGSLYPVISSKNHKKWARSGRVPFKVMDQTLRHLGLNAFEELAKSQVRFVYPYGKYSVQLPLRAGIPGLLETVSYLTPAPAQNTVILTTGMFRTTAKRDHKEVVQMTASLFDISTDSFQCFDGRSFRLANELVCDYLQTFFQYEKPWQALAPKEQETIIAQWEAIL